MPTEVRPLSSLLLSIDDAAIALGIGRTQTYELVMSGKIASVKIGRRRLIVRSELESFVQRLSDLQRRL
jgi:excisionase family DNA binding protein